MAARTPLQHGERRCYLRGCRRPECRDAHYRYMSRIRLERARGQRRRVAAAPVTAHLHQLAEAGWTMAQIERATGASHRTISPVLAAARPTVNPATARRILALPVGPPPADQVDTDPAGTIRRVRALVAIGHTYPAIATVVGVHRDVIGVIARGDRPTVRVTTAQAVARAYKKLSRIPGASVRARMQAARLGWHGPLAWDDIDDPAAEPEQATPYEPVAKNGRDSMRKAEIEHLHLLGESVSSIAKKFDGNEKYVSDLLSAIRRDREARSAAQELAA